MLEDLKKEFSSFFQDINKNVKNEEDLSYVRTRTENLMNNIFSELETIINYKEEKINAIIKKQKIEDAKIQELSEKIDNIYEDIYDENDEDFEISCPYCNYKFSAEIDEEFNEIKCPECGNTIELDWNGNPDDGEDSGCSGGCSHCGGC